MRIFKRRDREDWWIDYRDSQTGKRVRKYVGPSKAQAQDVLAKIRTEIVEKGFFEDRKPLRVPFEDFTKDYLEWAKANKKSWAKDALYLRRLGQDFNGKLLSEITAHMIEQYKAARSQETRRNTTRNPRPITRSQVNRELEVLKGLFNKAIQWGKASENPFKHVKLYKVDNKRVKYLDQKQIAALLAACTGSRAHLKAVVTVALNTGMRRGEILSLKWTDIDYKNKLLYVREAKSGEGRAVPMNEAVLDALRSCISIKHLVDATSEYVFCDRNGRPYKDVKTGFHSAMRQAGITGFRFHDLRHTFASHLASNGVDVMVLKDLLGHKTLAMTLRYAHLFPDRKRKAVEMLGYILRSPQEKPVADSPGVPVPQVPAN